LSSKITPPVRARLKSSWITWGSEQLVTAWQVIDEVACERRYRCAISAEVKRDLLRLATLDCSPVFTGIYRDKPYFEFFRALAEKWLEEGGRSWIIAELEARSSSIGTLTLLEPCRDLT
jgi:hypothetical protein